MEQSEVVSTEPVVEPKAPALELPAAAGRWVLAGFLGFGSVLGLITGASRSEGIGESLLTGLLAFVGGGLLSLIGFVLKNDETPQVRAQATGQALVGLAIGVWLGLVAGIYARLSFEAREDARLLALVKAADEHKPAAPAPAPAEADAEAPADDPPPRTSAIAVAPKLPSIKPERLTLLHSDPALCSVMKKRITDRIKARYYEEVPGAKEEDERARDAACKAPN